MIFYIKDHYFHTGYVEENVKVNFEPFFSSQQGYIPPFPELTDFDRGVLKVCGDWGAHPDKEDFKILLSCPQHQEVVKGIYDKLDHQVITPDADWLCCIALIGM